MLSAFFSKKKAQSSKSPFKEGRWDIIKGIHSIHQCTVADKFYKED
jgi:hypothetical protein